MSSNQENQASDVAVGAMAERMGITVSFATANKVVGHMPVEGNTQPFGLVLLWHWQRLLDPLELTYMRDQLVVS
jgi:hypothetical protein